MSGKTLLLLAGVIVAAYFLFFRVETVAHDAYRAALPAADEKDRLVLLFFTGSDWCGSCVTFEREAFSQAEFRKYALENLEIVVVDFPREKSQPPEIRQQNKLLSQSFGVSGYPTLILVNSRGQEVARRSGTTIDGPMDLIAWAESAR